MCNPRKYLRQQPSDYKLIRRISGAFFFCLAILIIRLIRLIRREKKKFAWLGELLKV